MELTLFVVVGAVAVLSAAMMLISENAIHSALFLILNFACIAFFFLMLHAPFLAMVQVAVYAGAIMVLFLFVIMLLGAERVARVREPGIRWLTPIAVVLAIVFLVTASVAIIQGEIGQTEEKIIQPHVRVIHVLDKIPGADEPPALDVYLDGKLVAEGLAFEENTSFERWDRGRYSLTAFAAGDDPDTATPLFPQPDTPTYAQQVELNSGEAISLLLLNNRTANINGPDMVVIAEDVSSVGDDELRLVAVNALHGLNEVDVMEGTDVLIDDLAYASASEPIEVGEGTYDIGVYTESTDRTALVEVTDQEFEANTSVLLVFAERETSGSSYDNVNLSLETDARPSFGSPQHVGQLLFSRYVLPFEIVALLLLVAMIGAIVLTHESLGSARKVVRRLANPPAPAEE
jgi:NADH:ubiquinone oxidoreductase subunit 6 (subunit J)